MSTPFSRHSALIGTVLQEQFRLQPDSFDVSELNDSKHNHLYLVELLRPTTAPTAALPSKVFTSPIPINTRRLVFRTPKTGMSLVDSVRIRNEVAFLAIGRDALSVHDESLVPRVFSWCDDNNSASDARWILQEWKEGEMLTIEAVQSMDQETQRAVLDQVAAVVRSFQQYRLPDGITGFGGLTFDDQGVMSIAPSTIPCGGPFTSYRGFLRGMCEWQLEASERSIHLNGWRDVPRLRERLDALFAKGLEELLERVPDQRPTLTHADLCFPNLLFDVSTYRLTAVLDFDFSHIGAPISEFLFSFWDVDGILPGHAQPLGHLRDWFLNGFPEKVDPAFKLVRSCTVLGHVTGGLWRDEAVYNHSGGSYGGRMVVLTRALSGILVHGQSACWEIRGKPGEDESRKCPPSGEIFVSLGILNTQ